MSGLIAENSCYIVRCPSHNDELEAARFFFEQCEDASFCWVRESHREQEPYNKGTVFTRSKAMGVTRKYDNKTEELGCKLISLGFNRGGCAWLDTSGGFRFFPEDDEIDPEDVDVPDLTHPSTQAVAMDWANEKAGFSKDKEPYLNRISDNEKWDVVVWNEFGIMSNFFAETKGEAVLNYCEWVINTLIPYKEAKRVEKLYESLKKQKLMTEEEFRSTLPKKGIAFESPIFNFDEPEARYALRDRVDMIIAKRLFPILSKMLGPWENYGNGLFARKDVSGRGVAIYKNEEKKAFDEMRKKQGFILLDNE